MSRFSPIRFSLAVPAALVLAQSAAADVTTAQVWGDWKQYMQGLGYQIAADEGANGSDLTINNLSITIPASEASGTIVISTGPMTFVQDGADVNIVLPDSMPVVLDASAAALGGDPWKMAFSFVQSGQSIKVSGDAQAMTYDYAAASFGLTLNEFITDGETYGPENARISISGTEMTNTTQMIAGNLRQYAQTGQVAALEYDIFMHNPIEDVKVTLKGNTSALNFQGTSSIPTSVLDAADMAQMLKAGFAVAGEFTYGAGAMDINVEQPTDGDFAATTTSSGGQLAVKMGAEALAYDVSQNGLKMSVTSAELPFPVELSMAQMGFKLGMPMSPSDEPKDFAFGMNLTDFVMADLLWSIFDPAAQLPRDPATFQMDLSGKMKLLVDIMNPEVAASTDTPAEVNTLTINNLLVNAVGAKLDGSGDFTFDNTDTTTFSGMAKPVGAVNLGLSGGNALLDKLVAMGLLPEQQAMGARMMMGLFAVPGDAPDTLKSKLEFNEAGQILANGQRIK